MGLNLIKEYSNKLQVTNAKTIFEEMVDIKDTNKEHFIIFHLDTRNNIILREIIGIGVLNVCCVDCRTVFRSAISNNCNSIIISHNHPSGDVSPSFEDKSITKKLIKAGDILGIKLLDHVIVGKNDYKSIIDEV